MNNMYYLQLFRDFERVRWMQGEKIKVLNFIEGVSNWNQSNCLWKCCAKKYCLWSLKIKFIGNSVCCPPLHSTTQQFQLCVLCCLWCSHKCVLLIIITYYLRESIKFLMDFFIFLFLFCSQFSSESFCLVVLLLNMVIIFSL